MPGEFIDEVHIFKCGETADGGAIMCSEITQTRIPFTLPTSADSRALGLQEADDDFIRIPLDNLVAALGLSDRTAQAGEHPST